MPLINVKLIDGVFSEPQKKQIVTKLTDATVSIEGENLRAATWVVSEEVKSGDWGMDRSTLTAADAKVLAAGRSAQAA
jgi:4-oxalocrotonate tautomerase